MDLRRLASSFCLLFAFASCSAPPPPTANAGTDQMVAVRQLVQLDGSGSMSHADEPGAQITRYAWAFLSVPSGSTASLNHDDIARPSFVPDLAGDYQLQLTVWDQNGSASATVKVTAVACMPSLAPITTMPAMPNVGDDVALSTTVTAGTGCDDRSPYTYSWSFVSVPAGSHAQLLPDAAAESPSFHADVAGDYTVSVRVTDSADRWQTARATITVGDCGHNAPVVSAVATSPAAPNTGDLTRLSATFTDADTDPNGSCKLTQSFRYAWSLLTVPQGSTATLDSATATNPWFDPDVPGDYTVRLVVTDSQGLSSAAFDQVVTVADCGSKPPVAEIGVLSPFAVPAPAPAPPATAVQVPVGAGLKLDASASSDPDNSMQCGLAVPQTLSYRWSLESVPAGSTASLDAPTAVSPSLVPDVPGAYVLDLVVTDSSGRPSAPARVQVDGFDAAMTVASGVGPYTSLALDDTTQDPRLAFYDRNRDAAFLASCSGPSCATNPAWSIDTIAFGAGRMISLATANGALYATWWDTAQCEAHYGVSTDGGKTWAVSPVQTNPSGCLLDNRFGCGNRNQIDFRDNGAFPVIAISPATGNPVVAFVGYVEGQVNNGGGGCPAWTDAGYDEVRYAVCTGGCTTGTPTWSVSSAGSGSTTNNARLGYLSIAFDPTTQKPSIAFRAADFDGSGRDAVGYLACTSGCDSASPTLSPPAWIDKDRGFSNYSNTSLGGEASTTSLAIGSTGQPSVAYYDAADNWLRYASCDGTCTSAASWNGIVVDSTGTVGAYASLALSPQKATLDLPRIAYLSQPTGMLRLASFDGGIWHYTDLAPSEGYGSLRLTPTDGVRVSHFGANAVGYYSSGN